MSQAESRGCALEQDTFSASFQAKASVRNELDLLP